MEVQGGFAIDRRFAGEGGSGGYARDAIPEMAWNEAAIWRACTKKHTQGGRVRARGRMRQSAVAGVRGRLKRSRRRAMKTTRCDTIRHDTKTLDGGLAGCRHTGAGAQAGRRTGSILPGGG